MQGYYNHIVEDVGEVMFFATVREEDMGIGDYEFQGARGFDSRVERVCGNIRWNDAWYTQEENEEIKKSLQDNLERIEEAIVEDAY